MEWVYNHIPVAFIKTPSSDETILYVPLVESNSDYEDIQRQVKKL